MGSQTTHDKIITTSRVIGALVIRDMKTRFGGSYIGFILSMGMPFLHLIVLFLIYVGTGRTAPLGTDSWAFLGSSILPFVIFIYPARMIMQSISYNKPLLYFPRVKIFDLIIARTITEAISSTIVSLVYITGLSIAGIDIIPDDIALFSLALLLTLYLGIALGIMNAIIAAALPFWMMAFNVSAALIFMISAIVILPDAIPEPYRAIFRYNPLAHCVELMRTGLYETYSSSILDPGYVIWFSTIVIVASLTFMRLFKSAILR